MTTYVMSKASTSFLLVQVVVQIVKIVAKQCTKIAHPFEICMDTAATLTPKTAKQIGQGETGIEKTVSLNLFVACSFI